MKETWGAALFLGLNFLSLSISAGEGDIGKGIENFTPARMIENKDSQYDYWSGIGRVRGDRSCTGSLLDTRVDGVAQGPAYILTNGHCINQEYSVILSDVPFSGTITFNDFVDTPGKSKAYQFKKVNWSSMRGVDIAIVELDVSLSQLIEESIQPMLFGPSPDEGADILVVGAPQSMPLHLAACQFESASELIVNEWVWRNTTKNRCQGIQSGSSGSPIIDRSSNLIIGVLNSTTQAEQPCLLDPRCELAEEGGQSESGVNYGNTTEGIESCFVSGVFSNDPLTCKLFPVYSIRGEPPRFEQNFVPENVSQGLPAVYPEWNFRFEMDTPFYRYKAARNARDCESPHYYSPAINSADAYINDLVGSELGLHVLCIVGVDSDSQVPLRGIMSNALSVAVELVDRSSQPEPLAELTENRWVWAGQWMYEAYFEQASPLYHQFFTKVGAPDETDCNDLAGYEEYLFDRDYRGYMSVGNPMSRETFCIYSKNIRGESSGIETYQPGNEEPQAGAFVRIPETSVLFK